MRIIAGAAKGRNFDFKQAFSKTTTVDDLRPTSAKVRESIFNILRDKLHGSVFLDLYAGTGSVGIEALSRGATKAVFVETSASRVKIIDLILSKFGFEERSRVINAAAHDFVTMASSHSAKAPEYDIIFLDPPYRSDELMKVLPIIGRGRLVRGSGVVIAEYLTKTAIPDIIEGLRLVKKYKYGDTSLAVYRLEDI
jgi:16S rRNA (guanine(966)-N(2))-methyltransferase RsmD